ncbi:MAG: FAD-binding oxidoreductase [Deltaproteobacteria bacterium]|nr:FAD-binding oxidoreductase [Deltaproteobacteria bacterium]
MMEELVNIVGEDGVSFSVFERTLYSHDLAPLPGLVSTFFNTVPDAVVQPRRTEEVAEIIKYARKAGIPVTPRGAATTGLGGAVATRGGIILDLTRMNKIEVDRKHGLATVGAGVRWGTLIEELEREGLTVRSYTSSAPSATVGGWISMGGLGIGTLKYGHVGEQIIEMEVVTPKGEVVHVSKQGREGYRMEWFFGSEGTLGVITEVKIQVFPKPQVISPHAVCFKDLDGMFEVVASLLESPAKPYYIEFADGALLDIKREVGLFAPETDAYAMFVFEGSEESVEQEVEVLRSLVEEVDGVEVDRERALEEWEERFYSIRIKRAGPTLLAGEILVPIARLGEAVDRLWQLKERYDLNLGIHGSVVSREHALVMPLILADERKRLGYLLTLPMIADVSKLALAVGGKPYGVGVWNSFYIKQVYGNRRVREMRELKRRLDPDNIMNPGKFYKVQTRFGIPLTSSMYRLGTFLLKVLKAFV